MQVNSLEIDVNKLQRSLEHVRTQYITSQKQLADQQLETDKYRNGLREREAQLRELEHREMTLDLELDKVRAILRKVPNS